MTKGFKPSRKNLIEVPKDASVGTPIEAVAAATLAVEPRADEPIMPLRAGFVPLDKTYVVTCWSPKGWTGKTTVATGLAHQYAQSLRASRPETRVLLMDFDDMGDIEAYGFCPVTGTTGVSDLYGGLAAVDSWESLSRYLLADERTGLYMLLGSHGGSLEPEAYGEILDAISRYFGIIVLDCGPVYAPRVALALSRANASVIVGDQTFPTIIHTVKFFAKVVRGSESLRTSKDNYFYVVNKYDEKEPSSLKEISMVMARYVGGLFPIPRDTTEWSEAGQDFGRTGVFSGDSGVRDAHRRLAEGIAAALKKQEGSSSE